MNSLTKPNLLGWPGAVWSLYLAQLFCWRMYDITSSRIWWKCLSRTILDVSWCTFPNVELSKFVGFLLRTILIRVSYNLKKQLETHSKIRINCNIATLNDYIKTWFQQSRPKWFKVTQLDHFEHRKSSTFSKGHDSASQKKGMLGKTWKAKDLEVYTSCQAWRHDIRFWSNLI